MVENKKQSRPINSPKPTRDSNIELLRIIAMFLVLLVHTDFYSLGIPSTKHISQQPLDSTLRFLVEALSIVCVNVFVLISGWFGIRPKAKGICNFLFQCLFFSLGIYGVTLLIGTSKFSADGLLGCITLTRQNWFITAYLLLYILSPILNAFVEHTPRHIFRNVLLAFFAFACTYEWLGGTKYMIDGYSPLSFMGLYLLARYLRLYQPSLAKFSFSADLAIYFGIAIIATLYSLFGHHIIEVKEYPWWVYVCPTTILAALYLFLAFTKISIRNRFINFCGASSFAVFLLHTHPEVMSHFRTLFRDLHAELSPLPFWGCTLLILIGIFGAAILIDQIRIFAWKKVLVATEKHFINSKEANITKSQKATDS